MTHKQLLVELNFRTEERPNGWFVIETRLNDGVQVKGELIYGPMPEKDVRPLIEEITRATKMALANAEKHLREKIKESLGLHFPEKPGRTALKRNLLLSGKQGS